MLAVKSMDVRDNFKSLCENDKGKIKELLNGLMSSLKILNVMGFYAE